MSVKMFKHKSCEAGQFPEVNSTSMMVMATRCHYCMICLIKIGHSEQIKRAMQSQLTRKSYVKAVLVWPNVNALENFPVHLFI